MPSSAKVSSRISASFAAIAAHDPQVRAFCDVRTAQAQAEAVALDRVSPDLRGALHGVPTAVKEVYDVAGCLCAWGTPIHAGRRPKVDCEAVARLTAAGAVVMGTTASTEYAMAREAPTGNPYGLDRSPGASSSGSAAAVAARMVDLALGSQTIGSGIRPAAYCGVLGLKPTHGAISLSGAMPLSSRLDHAVLFAREMDLIERALRVLAAPSLPDAGTAAMPSPATPGHARIALVPPWFSDHVDDRTWCLIQAAVQQVAGAERLLTLPPSVAQGEQHCLETILAADMWRHHGDDERRAGASMSAALRDWLARGRQVSDDDRRRALDAAARIADAMAAAIDGVDVLATLATTGIAPLRTEGSGSRAPQRLWSLLGWPALTVPVGLIDGLPVAVQLIARPGDDLLLLDCGRSFAARFTVPPPRLSTTL